VVTQVIDGDTVLLADGREVRLVGIQAPKLPLGRAGFETWPLADAAQDALDTLCRGATVTLGFGGRRMDRHGRVLAHLTDEQGRWLQGEMLAKGLARVYSFADNRVLAAEMLALEREARAARRGIWADSFYRIRDAADVGDVVDSFQLVEGRVVEVAIVRGRGYLNFGADWRTDFTLSLDPASLRLVTQSGLDIASLEGRRLRARGWIKSFNGPMIEITHPEQIEVLPE
jgi:endonuclease YncB( thermonuclease family)